MSINPIGEFERTPGGAVLMDGIRLRGEIIAGLRSTIEAAGNPAVCLATVLVGDDKPSQSYIRSKQKKAGEAGIQSRHTDLPATASQAQVNDTIAELAADPAVHGILCQFPLPDGLDMEQVLEQIPFEKDVDGLHPTNLGRLVMGAPGPLPCTPAGIVELLAAHKVPVEGRHVVVIGRGLTIGRPLSLLLAMRRPGCNAAVTVVHTGVDDLASIVRTADVVVAAAGVAGLVTKDMVKPGAAVVGAGTSWSGKKLMSDVDDAVAEVAGWITPRIGGVGPMTRAMLLRNAVLAAEKVR